MFYWHNDVSIRYEFFPLQDFWQMGDTDKKITEKNSYNVPLSLFGTVCTYVGGLALPTVCLPTWVSCQQESGAERGKLLENLGQSSSISSIWDMFVTFVFLQ